jgi:hypothetical protein
MLRGTILAPKTLYLEQMIFLKACTSGARLPRKVTRRRHALFVGAAL